MKNRLTLIVLVSAAGGVLVGLVAASRAFVEKASYTLRRKDGPFEVRDYPELTVASASMGGESGSTAFEKLVRFIRRSNVRQEKIAMTAPVLIEGGWDQGTMSFIMPEGTRNRGVPEPNSGMIKVGVQPLGRVAVYRFFGMARRRNEEKAIQKLQKWMSTEGLRFTGEPIVAYYDAPWLPAPLRRNEVMLRVER